MKLQPGDYVAQKYLTDEQYHAIAKKFMEAGAEAGEYTKGSRAWCHENYFGWGNKGGLFHGGELKGRLLTPSQILEDDEPEVISDWHTRHEPPPVTTECEVDHNQVWRRCRIIAWAKNTENDLPDIIFQTENDWDWYNSPSRFRPIKSDRDKVVELAVKTVSEARLGFLDGNAMFFGALYDAGLLKLPEGESK